MELLTDLKNLPWLFVRVDEVFSIQQGKQVSQKNRVGDNQRFFLRTKNIFWNSLDLSNLDQMHFTDGDENRLKLQYGDLLLCEGGSVGRTAIWRDEIERCYYQNHLHRLRVFDNTYSSEFALYWFWYAFEHSSIYSGRKNNTTIPNLSRSRLSELPIPFPPLEEQQKIAITLSLVQDSITQQEQLITLTTELKKNLMQKLFTEGIYNEPQRKTEVGVIPESWDVQKLGQIAKLKSGGTPSREKLEYWNSGSIPWVKTTEINYNLIKETEEYITQEGLDNSSANIFPKGTLLMAMYGQGVTRGRVAILDIDASTNQACVAITPNPDKEISIKFIYYYFTYRYENLRQLGHGANQSNLSATILKGFPIAFPKPESQIQISETLEKIDIKLEQHQQKRNCLTGLFRTLLHQLMTAQIRVDDLKLSALNLETQGGEE